MIINNRVGFRHQKQRKSKKPNCVNAFLSAGPHPKHCNRLYVGACRLQKWEKTRLWQSWPTWSARCLRVSRHLLNRVQILFLKKNDSLLLGRTSLEVQWRVWPWVGLPYGSCLRKVPCKTGCNGSVAIEYIQEMGKREFLRSMCKVKKAKVSLCIRNCGAVRWSWVQVVYVLTSS